MIFSLREILIFNFLNLLVICSLHHQGCKETVCYAIVNYWMRIFPMPINYRVLNLFSMPIGIFTCQKGKMCNNSLTGKTHRILPMLQIYCIFLHNLVLTRCATLLLNCKFPSTVCYAVTMTMQIFHSSFFKYRHLSRRISITWQISTDLCKQIAH